MHEVPCLQPCLEVRVSEQMQEKSPAKIGVAMRACRCTIGGGMLRSKEGEEAENEAGAGPKEVGTDVGTRKRPGSHIGEVKDC